MDSSNFKIAVVTPYFRIESEKLERCISSVARQTFKCDHILVADGEPQAMPEGYDIIHMALPFNVGNGGATPRGFGAQYAFVQGYDAVAFLDADNWYEPDHIELAANALAEMDVDVIFARRHVIFPDGDILQTDLLEDVDGTQVDTNCYVISKKAAFLASLWSMYPKEFGAGEDRLMLSFIKIHSLKSARLNKKTVWYESNWIDHYELAGKIPTQSIRTPVTKIGKSYNPQILYERTGIRTRRKQRN